MPPHLYLLRRRSTRQTILAAVRFKCHHVWQLCAERSFCLPVGDGGSEGFGPNQAVWETVPQVTFTEKRTLDLWGANFGATLQLVWWVHGDPCKYKRTFISPLERFVKWLVKTLNSTQEGVRNNFRRNVQFSRRELLTSEPGMHAGQALLLHPCSPDKSRDTAPSVAQQLHSCGLVEPLLVTTKRKVQLPVWWGPPHGEYNISLI